MEARFISYHGRPIVKPPVCMTLDFATVPLPRWPCRLFVDHGGVHCHRRMATRGRGRRSARDRVAAPRFGVFEAGIASTKDPKFTVVPQRKRLTARQDTGSIVR